jgi:hypothetical protein
MLREYFWKKTGSWRIEDCADLVQLLHLSLAHALGVRLLAAAAVAVGPTWLAAAGWAPVAAEQQSTPHRWVRCTIFKT